MNAPPPTPLLAVVPLTRAAFEPYGDVIEAEGSHSYLINEDRVRRHHDLARVDVAGGGGRPLISLFRAQATPTPLAVRGMERHPLGSQAFYPLSDRPFLVVVAPPGEIVRPESLCAFLTNGRQGVNYRRDVWHHMLIAPVAMDFLVVDRGGPGDNCVEYFFPGGPACRLEF